jgi:hypothetical protein
MHTKLRVPATQAPMRGSPVTSGRLSGRTPAIFASPAGEIASPAMSDTTPDRSRMRPSPSTIPGRSPPGGP